MVDAASKSTAENLPVEHAVALVLRNSAGEFMAVRRSDDDVSLPGVWGLPAVSLRPGEAIEEAVLRAGRQKLGVEVEIKCRIGSGRIARERYVLDLADYEVSVVSGTPQVPQPDRSVSQYEELKFTADASILRESAQRGSLCSRVFLDTLGVPWQGDTPDRH